MSCRSIDQRFIPVDTLDKVWVRDGFFRNQIDASPEQIVLGAGTEHLLGLVMDILPGRTFALEDPCYSKLARILTNKGMDFEAIPVDAEGMRADILRESRASVAYVTPARHFPLGTIMSAPRRKQLTAWAEQAAGRYIIEDDYDSEYRYKLRQIPALCSTNRSERIIYLNTFTRTLAPSLRIAYMILPADLLDAYQRKWADAACVISSFEQSALRRFLEQGYYERHLSRMRTIYRERRDAFVAALSGLEGLTLSADEAGLHFLIRSPHTEREMIEAAAKVGVKVYPLSECYIGECGENHTVMVGFGGLDGDSVIKAAALLRGAWKGIAS